MNCYTKYVKGVGHLNELSKQFYNSILQYSIMKTCLSKWEILRRGHHSSYQCYIGKYNDDSRDFTKPKIWCNNCADKYRWFFIWWWLWCLQWRWMLAIDENYIFVCCYILVLRLGCSINAHCKQLHWRRLVLLGNSIHWWNVQWCVEEWTTMSSSPTQQIQMNMPKWNVYHWWRFFGGSDWSNIT